MSRKPFQTSQILLAASQMQSSRFVGGRSHFSRRTGKLPPAHFYLGSIGSVDGRRTVVARSSDSRRTVVGRSSGRTSGRRACRQRCRQKKSFDRGGPVWPPGSNVTNDRLGVGSKIGGSGRQRPPAKKNDVTVIYRNRRLTKPYVPDIVRNGEGRHLLNLA